MLPATKEAVSHLKEAGLTREDFRIKTPWLESKQEYGTPIIVIVSPYARIAPSMQKLSQFFKVIVTCVYDGIPCHVAVTLDEPGLYKREKDVVEKVEEITYQGEIEQLPLWPADEAKRQEVQYKSEKEEADGVIGVEQEV